MDKHAGDQEAHPTKKLMICYDGSPTAIAMTEKTIELYRETKPEIKLVMIGDVHTTVGHTFSTEWEKKQKEIIEKRAQLIREQGYERVESLFYVGNPKEKILEAVEEINPDVVVVGRLGETKMQRMILGTISHALVVHSPCPVLIV